MKLNIESMFSAYTVVDAPSWEHPIARFNNNPLIRALRPLQDTAALQAMLTCLPEYDEAERHAPATLKVQLLEELPHAFFGLPRCAHLMETIHGMIFQSYVSRQPFSREDILLRQSIFQAGTLAQVVAHCQSLTRAEYSTALLGLPGTGKTQAILRATSHLRCVFRHKDLGVDQVPVLFIEMPSKGASILTLAWSIISALNSAYPTGNYAKIYLRSKVNAEVLLLDALNLLQIHYVGLLVVDESQNTNYLTYSQSRAGKTGDQIPLASLLITTMNALRIPLLLCATPELRNLLAGRLSMKRRLSGRGMSDWGPLTLPEFDSDGNKTVLGEFDVFLDMLWPYQWTKTPFELTTETRNTLYHYTLGIHDLVVKFFHAIQLFAIRNIENEVVTIEVIHRVAREEFSDTCALLDSIRKKEIAKISAVSDVAAFMRIPPFQHLQDINAACASPGSILGAFDEGGEVSSTDKAKASERPVSPFKRAALPKGSPAKGKLAAQQKVAKAKPLIQVATDFQTRLDDK